MRMSTNHASINLAAIITRYYVSKDLYMGQIPKNQITLGLNLIGDLNDIRMECKTTGYWIYLNANRYNSELDFIGTEIDTLPDVSDDLRNIYQALILTRFEEVSNCELFYTDSPAFIHSKPEQKAILQRDFSYVRVEHDVGPVTTNSLHVVNKTSGKKCRVHLGDPQFPIFDQYLDIDALQTINPPLRLLHPQEVDWIRGITPPLPVGWDNHPPAGSFKKCWNLFCGCLKECWRCLCLVM